jgi:hypothetical protein
MIPETVWAYLAGFVDGEGCINISQRKRKINGTDRLSGESQFNISNMNLQNLLDLQYLLKLGKIQEQHEVGKVLTYYLRFRSNEAKIILPNIIPYLIQKKEIAEIYLEWVNLLESNHVLNNLNIKQRRKELYALFEMAQEKQQFWKYYRLPIWDGTKFSHSTNHYKWYKKSVPTILLTGKEDKQ